MIVICSPLFWRGGGGEALSILTMPLIAFHIYRAVGSRRTEVLAGTAAYAPFLVHDGYLQRFLIIGIHRYHHYGSCGTVACAVSTAHSIAYRQTVLPYPYGMTYPCRRFLLTCYGLYGISMAHLRTACTLRAAISSFVRHLGLHEMRQRGARS